MKYKIELGEPKVIAQGPPVEEAGWGPYQFPSLEKTNDGRFLVHYNVGDDSITNYGHTAGWAQSADNGNTWTPADPEEALKLTGVMLKDGIRFRIRQRKAIPVAGLCLPDWEAKGKWKNTVQHFYDMDKISHIMEKKWVVEKRSPSGELTVSEAVVDFPGMTAFEGVEEGMLAYPEAIVHTRIAPDGSIWVPYYGHCKDPVTGGMSPYYDTYFLRSTDQGSSFHVVSRIPYRPDTSVDPDAFWREGFCEADITWMPDGSMISLLRTASDAPSYIIRSVDEGKTWSEPVIFDQVGVMPCLCRMACGVTLASYGRPGLYIRATEDPSGMAWGDPCQIISPKNHYREINHPESIDPSVYDSMETQDYTHVAIRRGTCSYTDLCPIDDTTALLVYSDFVYPDGKGIKRKSIMSRRVFLRV